MHRTPLIGCYKAPPLPPVRPTAEGGEAEPRRPELLTHLTMRVRFWIVAQWLPREEAA